MNTTIHHQPSTPIAVLRALQERPSIVTRVPIPGATLLKQLGLAPLPVPCTAGR